MDLLVTTTRFYVCLGGYLSLLPYIHAMPSHIHYMHIHTGSLICMNNLGQDYCMQVFPDDQHARVHVYSLAVAFRIWSKPHYRSKSFQHDLLANLSNVAIPGTGEELQSTYLPTYLSIYLSIHQRLLPSSSHRPLLTII